MERKKTHVTVQFYKHKHRKYTPKKKKGQCNGCEMTVRQWVKGLFSEYHIFAVLSFRRMLEFYVFKNKVNKNQIKFQILFKRQR